MRSTFFSVTQNVNDCSVAEARLRYYVEVDRFAFAPVLTRRFAPAGIYRDVSLVSLTLIPQISHDVRYI